MTGYSRTVYMIVPISYTRWYSKSESNIQKQVVDSLLTIYSNRCMYEPIIYYKLNTKQTHQILE